jgi:hypothetical protein
MALVELPRLTQRAQHLLFSRGKSLIVPDGVAYMYLYMYLYRGISQRARRIVGRVERSHALHEKALEPGLTPRSQHLLCIERELVVFVGVMCAFLYGWVIRCLSQAISPCSPCKDASNHANCALAFLPV